MSKLRAGLRTGFVTDDRYALTEQLEMAADVRVAALETVRTKWAIDREAGRKHRLRTRQGRSAGQGQDRKPATTQALRGASIADRKIRPVCGQASMST